MTEKAPQGEAIAPTARPRVAAGARLQTDRVTGRPALLFPEGMLQLNPTGAAILELCDGRRSVTDVAAALAERFKADAEVLRADVIEYLGRLRQRRLIELDVDGGVGGAANSAESGGAPPT